MKNFISSLIKIHLFVWMFAVWTIVGLLFWIPRLFLAISQFSALIVLMEMSVSGNNKGDLNDILESATKFYPNGFVLMYNTFFEINSQEEESQTKSKSKRKSNSIIGWSTVLVRVIYTFFFWLISFSFILGNYTIYAYFGLPFLIVMIFGISVIWVLTKSS